MPFGGRMIGGIIISGKYASPPIKVGVNKKIQAKTRKSKNRTTSEIVNPIKPKFEDSSNHQLHFVCGLPLAHSKPNMADGRRL